jgi:hypothetical protein
MNMRGFLFPITLLLAVAAAGCSVHRAANQPSKKDTSVLRSGIPRDLIIAEFGAPVTSEPFEDGKKEIYTFIQGYSKANRTSRAVFHGAADLFTLGLWEIVGTPVEGNYTGKKMTVRVIYDAQDMVKSAETLSISDP